MSWNASSVRKNMRVYTVDQKELGHVADVYEDSFLVHKGFFFPTNRYIPYSAIASVEQERIALTMSADDARALEWEKRPDYENHPGDPTQLFYDRGHGVRDPFDETNPGSTGS